MYSGGRPAGLNCGGLILAEFRHASKYFPPSSACYTSLIPTLLFSCVAWQQDKLTLKLLTLNIFVLATDKQRLKHATGVMINLQPGHYWTSGSKLHHFSY